MSKQQKGYVSEDPTYARKAFIAVNSSEMKAKLDEYGVCVIPRLFTEEEVDKHRTLIIKDLEKHIRGFKYDDPKTWPILHDKAKGTHRLIIQNHGFGWLPSVVNARVDPKIVDVFLSLWKQVDKRQFCEKDLLSSSDALGICLMPSRSDQPITCNGKVSLAGYHRCGHDWLHWDQKPSDQVPSFQSFINLFNVTKEVGSTLSCLVGSHKHQEAFYKKFGMDDRFGMLKTQEEYDFYVKEKGCEHGGIRAEEGDRVIWNSKTIHQGRSPVYKEDFGGVIKRLVVYSSLQPRYYATSKDLKRKKAAWEKLTTTTHNAAGGVELFNKKPRIWSKDDGEKELAVPVTNHPMLDQRQKLLYGI